jgi:inosose dehydratase
MYNTSMTARRRFLQAGLLGSAAWIAGRWSAPLEAAATKPERDPFAGLKVGVASYSLRKFPLDEALAMTRQAGVKYITLKDMHLPLTSSTAQRQEARRKVEEAGLVLLGGGVIYLSNREEEIRAAFQYATEAGIPTIVACPDPASLDTVEKLAKEFDIRVAIHNHGPGDKRYPSPLDVMKLIQDRDAHLGVCIDVGHTVRLEQDPVEVIRACAGRLYDFHIKDVTQAAAKGVATEVGRGIIDIVAVLKTLIELKFSGHLALEYEIHADAPLPGMIESFAYIRGVLAVIAG